jgi:hypothetical protein
MKTALISSQLKLVEFIEGVDSLEQKIKDKFPELPPGMPAMSGAQTEKTSSEGY